MKTESTAMPQHPFEVEGDGEFVDILFYEDVKPVPVDEEHGGSDHYAYEMYRLSGIRNRPGLESAIAENFEDWMTIARQKDAPSVDPPKLEDRVTVVEDALIFLALGGM